MLKNKITKYPRRLLKDDRGWFLKVITGKEEKLPPHTGEVILPVVLTGKLKGHIIIQKHKNGLP